MWEDGVIEWYQRMVPFSLGDVWFMFPLDEGGVAFTYQLHIGPCAFGLCAFCVCMTLVMILVVSPFEIQWFHW